MEVAGERSVKGGHPQLLHIIGSRKRRVLQQASSWEFYLDTHIKITCYKFNCVLLLQRTCIIYICLPVQ